MHKAINIKHRVVRRVDIGKAPLATFDTIDLGDEDVWPGKNQQKSTKPPVSADTSTDSHPRLLLIKPRPFVRDGGLKTETIGGNNSKKSLSQAGGEEKENKDVDRARDKKQSAGGEVENVGDTNQSKGTLTESPSPETQRPETKVSETYEKTDIALSEKEDVNKGSVSTSRVSTLSRQGTIGRVSIPIKKQDSDSSSSSSGSCKESTFTFHAPRPSIVHLEGTHADTSAHEFGTDKEGSDSLFPEIIDPSQILSPSKRKAYERRIERLKVTTSPIARPRSTTPISVVTLDEYAAISSPEPSPASPCVPQDKLKITLPSDEFTAKPKIPKLYSAKKQDSSDTSCFEFAEEILFSHTKSALVVNEDGQLPLSPRRVLIPPTLTPASSPKLSAAPRLSAGLSHEEASIRASKLIYIQHNESAHKLFGETVDATDDENWAHFPDFSEPTDVQPADADLSKDAILTCDSSEHGEGFAPWPDEEDQSSETLVTVIEVTKTLHNKLPDSQTEAAFSSQARVHKSVNDFLTEEPFSSHLNPSAAKFHFDSSNTKADLDLFVENSHFSESLSQDFCFTQQTEFPGLVVESEFETEEEILTVEISEGASGCEKHIEIEIKSSGSSGSISPAASEPPYKVGQLYPEGISAIPKVKSDSAIFIHSAAGNSDVPVPSLGIGTSKSHHTSLALFENQQLGSVSENQTVRDQILQPTYASSDNPTLQTPVDSGLIHKETPVFSDPHQIFQAQADVGLKHSEGPPFPATFSSEKTISSQGFAISQRPQHVQQQLPQPFDLGLALQQQGQPLSSTNPFASDLRPQDSDPFDLGFSLASTNPFLSDPNTVSSDLIDFSSSFDTSQT